MNSFWAKPPQDVVPGTPSKVGHEPYGDPFWLVALLREVSPVLLSEILDFADDQFARLRLKPACIELRPCSADETDDAESEGTPEYPGHHENQSSDDR
jgi:hypothetical protein